MDPFLLTAIGSAAMAAAALITSIANYRQRKAGAEKTSAEGWSMLIDQMGKRIAAQDVRLSAQQERIGVLESKVVDLTTERDSLREQVKERDGKIASLEARVDLLTKQIVALRHRPFDAGAWQADRYCRSPLSLRGQAARPL